MKSDVESIDFVFKEGNEERVHETKDELLKILSTGEQRALYILNIIFEVEAREKEDHETILVIDDIVDSFDYKNKYAIIEYLKYMSEINKFYGAVEKVPSCIVGGNCLVQNHHNHPVRLRLPPLHRRRIALSRYGTTTPSGCACHPSTGGELP